MVGNLTNDEEVRLINYSLDDGDLLALTTTAPTESSAGTEVTGGSYARQPVTWDDEGGGVMSSASPISFSDMPTAELIGWNLYDSAGTDRKWYGVFSGVSGYATGGVAAVFVTSHPFVNDDKVTFEDGDVPPEITIGDVYYVVESDTLLFGVSETLGGDPIVFSGDLVNVVVGKVYDIEAGSTFYIPAGPGSISFSLT